MATATTSLDQLISQAIAREDAALAEQERKEAERMERERKEQNEKAYDVLVKAVGGHVAGSLMPVTHSGVGYARFAYKGTTFEVWECDRSQGWGIRLVVPKYTDDHMRFVYGADGILAYIGRMAKEPERLDRIDFSTLSNVGFPVDDEQEG